MSALTRFYYKLVSRLRPYATKRTVIALAILLAFVGFAVVKSIQSKTPADAESPTVRAVETATLASLSANGSDLEVVGTVKSSEQADLRAQRAGVVNFVGARVGQFVPAGTIVAATENDAERATVQQAQAGVAQAQAQLNKVIAGARDEELAVLGATTDGAQRAYEESLVSARNTLLSAYTTLSSTFEGSVDTLFGDADSANPELKFQSTNASAATAAEHERFLIQGSILDSLAGRVAAINSLSAPSLLAELTRTQTDVERTKGFLDNVVTALDGGIETASVTSTTITTYTTTATAARTSILSTLSTLTTARSAINSAESALTVATENENQGVSGARQEDIEVSEAQLAAARASLAQAIASLEDTRIRTPVSGTLTTFTLERGDFVTAFENVGVVANEGALEVVIFVSPETAATMNVGDAVTVDNVFDAVVTSIAKGLDQARKQIEVRIGVTTSTDALPNGKSVTIALSSSTEDESEAEAVRVPISSLKLVGNSAFVFTVSEDGVLVAHQVEVGNVTNTHVNIETELLTSAYVVVDARGLNEGDLVTTE